MPTNPTLVVLEGRLVKELKSYVTASDALVAGVTIAIDDDRQLPDGSWEENTMFLYVEGWNRVGQYMLDNFKKGDLVFIEGKLKQSRFEADGQERVITKVWVERSRRLARPSKNGGHHENHTFPECQAEEESYQYAYEEGRVPF